MKTFLIVLSIAFCFPFISRSQSTAPEKTQAELLFSQQRFADALPLLIKFLGEDPGNALLNYQIGSCYFYSRSQKLRSIPYLERAVAAYESPDVSSAGLPPLVYKLLAEAYNQSYEFDKAIINYEKYKSLLDPAAADAQKEIEEAGWRIDMCRVGKALDGLAGSAIDLKKEKKGKASANSIPKGAYSSFLSADHSKVTFTFGRENRGGDYDEDSRYYEPLTIQLPKDTVALPATKIKFEKKNKNETTIATSVDGQIVLNYRDDNGTANLYATCLNGNTWTKPEKLDRVVNTIGWEQDEYISADGSVMYFTSNRKGGYGGKDIYRCRKLGDGEWGKAENLGPAINTPYDEEAPFIHPDGVTLYFSSNGKQTIGKYDVFSSTFSAGNWSQPVNIGYPIDTTHDLAVENIPVAAPLEKVKKKRKKNKDENEQLNLRRDNYLISFNNLNGAPLTLLKGEFISPEGKIRGPVKITIRNNENGQTSAVYYSDSASQKYAMILPPGKNNNITYQKPGYMIFSENIDLVTKKDLFEKRLPLELFAIGKNTTIRLNNIFYDHDKATFNYLSDVSLNDLHLFLKDNPGLVVEFNNTIVAKEDLKANARLSEERAKALVSYMTGKGISKDRLIANGTAIKMKHARNKTDQQMLELRIVEDTPGKELLSTQ